MPVWAAIAAPVIGFCWIAWLVAGWIDKIRLRHAAAEQFSLWMSQNRENHDA